MGVGWRVGLDLGRGAGDSALRYADVAYGGLMPISDRPAVQRVQPPSAPYLVVNRVLGWVLSSPRRASRIGEHLLLLHLIGRKTGRRIDVPVAFGTPPTGDCWC